MAPSNVLMLRHRHILTPYNAAAWESELRAAGLLAHFPLLVDGLRHGFMADVRPIAHTFTPPNSPTLAQHTDHFWAIVDAQMAKGRYVGPFSAAELKSLIGPFQSSPLSLVLKPQRIDVFRLVQNFSFPPSPHFSIMSINYTIDSTKYPCTWGTFPAMCFLVWSLPPGCQAAVRDVAEAYRTVPLHPSQWPGAVVRLDDFDRFVVDLVLAFGMSPSAGIFGYVADAAAAIFRSHGLGPLLKWVDDHVFIHLLRVHLPAYKAMRRVWRDWIQSVGGEHHTGGRLWYGGYCQESDFFQEFAEDCAFLLADHSGDSPRSAVDSQYAYNMDDVDRVSVRLGIPWEPSKDLPFASEFSFTGFSWNLATKTVALTERKRVKYVDAIHSWLGRVAHTLEDV